MINGGMFRKILLFAMPLAASNIIQQLYNSIDVAVVGRFASSEALAAVGSNGSLINLMINIFVGVSVGANVLIAHHIGQANNEAIKRAISTSFVVAVVSGVVMMVVGVGFARPILELIDTPPEVIDLSTLYLRIYFVGIPFLLIYNFGAAILRSMGDTRRPLYCLFVSGLVNTLLNLVLVVGFDMSVAGVAIGTVVSFIINAVWVTILLFREAEPFGLRTCRFKIYKSELKRMMQIGVPAGVQGMVFSFANVFIQAAINRCGADAVAGSATALNYEYYCYFVISAFATTTTTFIGQNYGAGKIDRCKRAWRLCMVSGVMLSALCNVVFYWQSDFFIGIFTTDADVAIYALQRMGIVLVTQWMACSYEISGGALRGFGYSVQPALMTVFGTCLLRLVWIYTIYPLYHTYESLMLVFPVSWGITGTMVVALYLFVVRRLSHVTFNV